MEDDPDDLDNLFDEYESISRPEGEENVDNPAASNEAKSPERVPVPVRRIIKNPRLKFNADRLCGERGIPVLAKHFKDVKFKGKGHEKENLDKLLASLTHWCHRLLPSMKFEDCLRQIEKLGKKRPVQTCLRKIRLDMPILNSDFVQDDDEVEREEDAPNVPDTEPDFQDAFDKLLNESVETSHSKFTSTPLSKQPSGNTLGTSFGSNLTEEQKKRMEYNRLLASERRKVKVAALQSANSESIDGDPCEVSTTPVVDLDSNPASGSLLKSPVHSGSENCERLFVNNSKETERTAKVSDELDLDQLMDLVEAPPIEEDSGNDNVLPLSKVKKIDSNTSD